MVTTGTGQIYDTTIFNNTLEALDIGKTVYIYSIIGSTAIYDIITNFAIISSNESLSIEIHVDSNTLIIYPSEGYNVSDLYTPTNIVILIPTEVPIPVS